MSGWLRTVLLISWFGLTARQLPAQTSRHLPLEFGHIQEAQGLSSNIINCLLEDRDGYLWIGTYGGLNRFDGSHFTVLKKDRQQRNSLANNVIHAICQDKDGSLWLATDDGISQYNSQTGQFRNIQSVADIALGQCVSIVADRTGSIWFSSLKKGLFQYDRQHNRFRQFTHDPGDSGSLSDTYISKNGLVEDPHRNGLWITTDKGVNYLDIASGRFLNYANNPEKLVVFRNHATSALTIADKDKLVFADNTEQQILVYNLVSKTVSTSIRLRSQTGRSTFPIATIFVDRNHNLWTSSWTYTLFKINLQRPDQPQEFFHNISERTSIAGDFFWSGWQQNDGTVWLGTVNGISYTNPEKTFYQLHNLGRQHPSLIKNQGITSFLEDDNGSWWLTSVDHELLHYRPAHGQLTFYPLPHSQRNELRFGLPMVIQGLNPNELYIVRAWSVITVDKQTGRSQPFPLPPFVFQRANGLTGCVRQGDTLWLFGRSDVIFCCHLPSNRWHIYPIPLSQEGQQVHVRSASFDHQGQLWVDIEGRGFIRFSASDQRFVGYPFRPTATGFTDDFAFIIDARHHLWLPVSTYGIVEFNPSQGSYRTWTDQDGLSSIECKAVCPDDYGQIWMASYNKFSIINPTRSSVRNFILPINEDNINYVNYMYRLRNGNILATLRQYVVEFMPRRVDSEPAPAHVLISSLRLPDTTMLIHPGAAVLQLGVRDNNFSVDYSALNQPQQAYTYFYRLDGYDDQWVKAGAQNVANYTKIPGGDYTFRVKAVTGKTETVESTLAIHVDIAFYETAWFRLGLFILALGLAYWLYRYRTRQTARVHSLQVQATRLERDKTEIQYQNLINHLNPHFLFNSLTSLNSLIITKPKEASLFLKKLSIIYRYILQNKDKELVSVQEELAFVQHYIDLQTTRFGEGLQIKITVDPACLLQRIVPVTIQNLLENAIKHNVISDDMPLHIQIFTENATLYVANDLQKKGFVETSHKQGLASLKSLYHYLSRLEVIVAENDKQFIVAIPLL